MLDEASTKLAEAKSEWVRRVLGVSVPLPVPQQGRTADMAAEAPAASLVRLQRARLTWEKTRATVRQSLRTLEFEMLKFFDGRAEMATAQDAVRRFDEVLQELDDDLVDTLDEALNEQDPARRQDMQAEARACIEDYEHFVQSSDLVAAIDGNPFTKVGLREMVLRSAAQLHAALG